MPFRFTVVGDGGTDSALKPILEWILGGLEHIATTGYTVEFTTGREGDSEYGGLSAKIDRAIRQFPCNVLFVHRDAEAEAWKQRVMEIDDAIGATGLDRHVPIVPVRMTEAWLLIDEAALRMAADNPNGDVDLALPAVRKLELLPDPKQVCDELLIRASEKTGRRKKKFARPTELAWRRIRVARLIQDFSPLLTLSAFKHFCDATATLCATLEDEDEFLSCG